MTKPKIRLVPVVVGRHSHAHDTLEASASLQIDDSAGGFLVSRLTTGQRDVIPSPAVGLQVFNTDVKALQIFDGVSWLNVLNSGPPPAVPSVNVKDFGAIGDGVTNDRAAVQAAIDSLGGTNLVSILFPPGTYRISGAALNLDGYSNFSGSNSAIRLTGSGRYVTKLVQDTDAHELVRWHSNQPNTPSKRFSKCGIVGMHLLHTGSGSTGAVVDLAGSDQFVMFDCSVEATSSGRDLMATLEFTGATISGNEFKGGANGWLGAAAGLGLQGNSNNVCEGNRFVGGSAGSIDVSDCFGTVLAGNELISASTTAAALRLRGSAAGALVSSNRVFHNLVGIRLDGAGADVVGNKVELTGTGTALRTGIYVGTGQDNPALADERLKTTVMGNSVKGDHDSGGAIYVVDSGDVMVDGNRCTCSGPTFAAVALSIKSTTVNVRVQGNRTDKGTATLAFSSGAALDLTCRIWPQDNWFAAGDFAREASAAPTTSYHQRDEIVMNNAAAAAGTIGSVCVLSGTPGTWKTWGAIGA